MSSALDPLPGFTDGPALARLEQILGWHEQKDIPSDVSAMFVPQSLLRLPDELLVRELMTQVDALCGTQQTFETRVEGMREAGAVVTGPQGSAQLRCRVQPSAPFPLEWLDLIPSVGDESPRPWSRVSAAPVTTCVSTDSSFDDELTDWLTELRERTQMPGVAAAVVLRGELVWSAGLGWSDIAAR